MMPSAQQVTTIKASVKPKIGFSIDSIVGNRMKSSSDNYCDDSDEGTNYPSREKSPKLPTAADLNNEYSNLMKRVNCVSPQNAEYDKSITRLSESSDQDHQNNNNSSNSNKNSVNDVKNIKQQAQSRSPSPVQKDRPIIVPGIPAGLIRPQHHPQLPAHYPDMSPSGHPHLLAHFQAAAALANVQAVQNGFNGPLAQHLPPHLHNPNMPRESYPLYPWLLSRHGRIFPHRFPGTFPDFLLQPFRKPKRVRTAFSPSQLLKLEHAFEGNHYVVGAERKTLAQQLSLTETQVKVWFQNRRTKHKRMQQEDGDSKSCNRSNGSPKNFDDEDDDDEMIDIGDECPSDASDTDNAA